MSLFELVTFAGIYFAVDLSELMFSIPTEKWVLEFPCLIKGKERGVALMDFQVLLVFLSFCTLPVESTKTWICCQRIGSYESRIC